MNSVKTNPPNHIQNGRVKLLLFNDFRISMENYLKTNGIDPDVFYKRRDAEYSAIKGCVVNLANVHFKRSFSLSDLAALIGRTSHCTALHYLKNHLTNYKQWELYKHHYNKLVEVFRIFDDTDLAFDPSLYDNIPQY